MDKLYDKLMQAKAKAIIHLEKKAEAYDKCFPVGTRVTVKKGRGTITGVILFNRPFTVNKDSKIENEVTKKCTFIDLTYYKPTLIERP